MLLIDTTVLVYATGDEHPLRAPALALLRDVVSARVSATTTPEVLQEFAHVRARRRGRSDAFAQVERFAALLAPVSLVSAREAIDGLRLWAQVDRLGSVNSVLAAVAINRNWELVSADRGFGGVPRLTWRDLSDYPHS